MTRKLYDENNRLLTFSGTVVACNYNEKKKLYEVELDQTAFFPEEGGQMPDWGVLGGQTVMDVKLVKDKETHDETIIHLLEEPVQVGDWLIGEVDWAHRFDQMQQHSGEHLISGLCCSTFKCNNVGFHLGPAETTLDFDTVITTEQMADIERRANQAVYENFEVLILYPSKEELKDMEYRSKIDIPGQVRIVEFPGYDRCACCAPHVARTGEIGMIKIVNVQKHRGGVRVNILCGERARADYDRKFKSVSEIAQKLSAKQDQVTDAFDRIMAAQEELKQKLITFQAAYLDAQIAALGEPSYPDHNGECSDAGHDENEANAGLKNALLILDGIDNIAQRNAVNSMAEKYTGFSGILNGNPDKGYFFIISSNQEDCRALAGRMRQTFGAKGGGSKEMIQGQISADPYEFKEWFMGL